MLHIVCVNQGNYLGRGVEYVNILFDQVRRNLEAGTAGEFTVFTDALDEEYHPGIAQRLLPSGVSGWWSKLYLFSAGAFPSGDRVVFFDLDTLVIGALDDIVKYDGDFAMLRDYYHPAHMQSSVMAWRAGFGAHIWDEYVEAGMPTHDHRGDQAWIEARAKPDALQDLFPGSFASFKVDCKPQPPKGAKVIVFHGRPRPHEVDGWVADTWKIGGLSAAEIFVRCNTELEHIKRNVEACLALGLGEVTQQAAHDRTVCIVGGAPSVERNLAELAARSQNGQEVWALNGAAKYLRDHGVRSSAQWIVDARPHNSRFVMHGITQYLASQCSPCVFALADNPVVFHDAECDRFIPSNRPVALIGGGTTVAMKALAGAYALGFRKIHLYGLDSSYDGERHHAYDQPENDREGALTVHVETDTFQAAPWMVRQVEDFQQLSNELAQLGCEIHVHCGGLLGRVAQSLMEQRQEPTQIDGDIVLYRGWWRPVSDHVSVQAVLNEVWKLDRVCEALPPEKRRTAIQAGGHVGIFPAHLAALFDQVHTFEPDATNYKCLARNVTLENVTLHYTALGDDTSPIALTERDAHNAGSIGIDPSKAGSIPVSRIDDLGLSQVDLIYLDIEGMEGPALWGALNTVMRDRPLIVCENKGLDDVSGMAGSLEAFMKRAGYRCVSRLMRDDVFAPDECAASIAA